MRNVNICKWFEDMLAVAKGYRASWFLIFFSSSMSPRRARLMSSQVPFGLVLQNDLQDKAIVTNFHFHTMIQ